MLFKIVNNKQSKKIAKKVVKKMSCFLAKMSRMFYICNVIHHHNV